MSYKQRQALYFLLAALIIAGCTWLWFTYMEKRWIALPQQSDAAHENQMLAATRLLTAHQHVVGNVSTLAEASLGSLADGTLILAENGGIVTPEQSKQLLNWVKRGNTLIIRPRWSGRVHQLACGVQENSSPAADKKNANAFDADPISSRLGVELVSMMRRPKVPAPEPYEAPPPKAAKLPPCLAQFTLPNAGYALQLDIDRVALASTEHSASPLFGDEHQEAVRVFAEGKGHIAAVANNYFDNDHLAAYDHAELLLSLAALNPNAKHVLIIQHLDMPAWYQALWWYFEYGIISLGCGVLLLFWTAVRRFGPILPEPNLERRSLIEHIDASGRWLWKIPGGRNILITAARVSINKTLSRKAPALLRMLPEEQAAHLSQVCKLSNADIELALHRPASEYPIHFTRQIQILQQLRKHYER
ncbi:MAG TPA: DUF4350 domain-containing protein [Burkholderiaceae bacterium]